MVDFLNANSEGPVAPAAVFAAISALVASIASAWMAARNARRTHISALRERWIRHQREDLSELLHLAAANPAWGAGGTEEGSPPIARRIASRIRLRLADRSEASSQHERLDLAIDRLPRGPDGHEHAALDALCVDVIRRARPALGQARNQARESR